MKRLYMSEYHYRDGLDEDDFRQLTKKFTDTGSGPGVLAHYERLDGRGGFMVYEQTDDPEKNYELTLQYGRWMEFDAVPVTTMEDAFPVIQRVYG